MHFAPAYSADVTPGGGLWFLFWNHQIVMDIANAGPGIPFFAEPPAASLGLKADTCQFLGTYDKTPCFTAELADEATLPETMAFQPWRQCYGGLDDELFWVIGRAAHLLHWNRTNRFCGCCGYPLQWMAKERGKTCPQCGNPVFPRISPAIIVAVFKGERILLARAARFTHNLYSILAGFVEPGETLEECVRREVYEEVGITIRDLRYFGSQPWPFPDSLMIAFTARHAAGEIRVDNQEITTADWFTAAELPRIPEPVSIARRMIDWFIAQGQSGSC
ncbi:NAD+ diphosphatase [Hydrogenispora ethanolica]|uniref:NAD(+) diphosphatase n=1 Tax=Hydrogenispora ethanolica TaxID=1082276 RepID=A0A4R1REK6_HYDET|nr:NAD(+) diphosphatase [Hydrogenispora ethanolica]TCL64279.1 NAD+ diphosphatase [Hydrogenispora ethanolica]